ncbi:metallophosphoesterase family protein [Bordetella genomosp. 13]|uniref:DNA repair exonuclease n=1 Tax=Bordetella genomosp. 13 TaxID=463040 RepID=A0A1W6ZDI2_9BORD|nr:DNA repair exonuclease [Bordetella genomosp. 13]ARP95433.1 DNA repair exonuclease [Bordetella genomosp. 13]
MIRFLHTADWQIGRQYGQFEQEDAAVLAEARFDVVARIAELAARQSVGAVLVAGDVFDTQAVSDRTIRRLFGAMQAYGGPWVMIAGNHDAMLADSVWTRARQLDCIGPNVRVASQCGVIELPEAGLAVLAAPLTQRHTYDDVTQPFDDLDTPPGLARVGLAHGSVQGRLPGDADAANPIAADRAARARLDYLALGDWHGCLSVDARTWYAGTPEQDRFRGNAPGYVLDVSIAAPGAEPEVRQVQTGRYRWSLWTERLALDSDAEALARRLDEVQADAVLRLVLEGETTLAAWEQLQQAIGRAAARARALLCDSTALSLEPQAADLAALQAGGYVADVAARLQAMQHDAAQADVAREALRQLLRLQRETGAGAA